MAKDDVRSQVIDKLEVFAQEYGLKFLWSVERRPDGCMTVQFKKADGTGITYRVTSKEIDIAKGNADLIADNIIGMVKNTFYVKE